MTLQEIANELQGLIDRLATARNLLASLRPESDFLPPSTTAPAPPRRDPRPRKVPPESASALLLPFAPPAPLASPAPTAPEPTAPRRLRARAQRTAHRRPTPPAPSALSGNVPSRPVAIPAAEVRSRQVVLAPAPPPQPTEAPSSGHSLDDLLRELASRQPASLSV